MLLDYIFAITQLFEFQNNIINALNSCFYFNVTHLYLQSYVKSKTFSDIMQILMELCNV